MKNSIVMHKGMPRRGYQQGGMVAPLGATSTLRRREEEAGLAPLPAAPTPAPVVAAPPASVNLGIKAPVTAAVDQGRQSALDQKMFNLVQKGGATTADLTDAQRATYERLYPPAAPSAGMPQPFKKGGKVPGKGSKDTVPAMLTPGEFVMTKGAVQKHGMKKMHAMNNGGMKRKS